jgi:hypothetical protein
VTKTAAKIRNKNKTAKKSFPLLPSPISQADNLSKKASMQLCGEKNHLLRMKNAKTLQETNDQSPFTNHTP